jgi:hypothetical protein
VRVGVSFFEAVPFAALFAEETTFADARLLQFLFVQLPSSINEPQIQNSAN